MRGFLIALTVSCAILASRVGGRDGLVASSVDAVVQWNRILLSIVRTPGAQPATIHPTRSFAIMHAAIYDAVNAIDRTHAVYMVRVAGVPGGASEDAAAVSAAHDVLVALYPAFKNALDTEWQQSLAKMSRHGDPGGIRIGQGVAERILALRSHDGSNAQSSPYVFGDAPGDYQSTPPNFPLPPQFTHWSKVTPFALARANLFRPGPPPPLTSERVQPCSQRSGITRRRRRHDCHAG